MGAKYTADGIDVELDEDITSSDLGTEPTPGNALSAGQIAAIEAAEEDETA